MKSFKLILVLAIVLLSTSQLKAQVDSLYVSSNFIGAYKVINSANGQKIKGPSSFLEIMNKDSEAFKYMLKSANSLNASKIIFWSGMAAGLAYSAVRINNPELREVPFIAVAGVLSFSTALYFLSKKQARKGVAIFNENPQTQKSQSSLQFKIHPTGLGLALNF